jgi:hypothetical protein
MGGGGGDRRWLAREVRVYRALLFIYPPEFRRAFGAEMTQAFRDGLRDAFDAGGVLSALGWYLRGMADLAGVALGLCGSHLARLVGLTAEHPDTVAATQVASQGGRMHAKSGGVMRLLIGRTRMVARPSFQQVPPEDLARFTGRARRSITLAREEARGLGHHYIGTEHLLLGLLAEGGGIAARALAALGVEREAARARVEHIIGQRDAVIEGEPPLTQRASRVIELAMIEAWRLKHPYIGTEHLLLGLLAEGEGIAAGVLEKCGLQLEQVRAKVLELLPPPPEVPPCALPWLPI